MFIIAIREVRRPAYALFWIITCLLLPIIGYLIYLITSHPVRLPKKALTLQHHHSEKLPSSFNPSTSSIADAINQLTVGGLRSSKVQILTNGTVTYRSLIEAIENAQRTIDMEYYIFRNDQIGRAIIDLLIKKAMLGVKIRFLKDGLGSLPFPRSEIQRLTDAGIECRTIFPVRFPWIIPNINFRDHCKIVVIDGMVAFSGGINIGDEYTGHKPEIGFWRDTHMQIVGNASIDLKNIFETHWQWATPEKAPNKPGKPYKQSLNTVPHKELSSYKWSFELASEPGELSYIGPQAPPSTGNLGQVYIQTIEGNPGNPVQTVRQVYFICLTQAKKTLDITTPYFVPDTDIMMSLKTAVARGVRVRLLVPLQADEKIVDLASRTYYGELLDAGVEIYLYKKGVLHAKSMIIDGEIVEMGAANYDMRSFRLNYEVCHILYGSSIGEQCLVQFERDLLDSIPLTIEDLLNQSPLKRILQQAARLLSPML